MQPYLLAIPRGVVVNPRTFEPNLNVWYLVEEKEVNHDATSLSNLIDAIESARRGQPYQTHQRINSHKIVLTPLRYVVPWMLAGLRRAVTTDNSHHLLSMIAGIREYEKMVKGFASEALLLDSGAELEMIEKSLVAL